MAALLGMGGVSHAQYVAVNDHASGPGTSPNATTYHILGQEAGTMGPLKNVNTGATLPAILDITRAGFVNSDLPGAAPAAGTPLFNAFDGLVDWSNNANNNVGLGANGVVTHTITGLDPAKTYIIQGGAVRGNATATNWWSLFSIVGADAFTSAHAGGLTTADVPAEIANNQVAINTGVNHLANQGHMFEWRDIQPGADGTIQILSAKYSGTVPGGSSVGFQSRGFALSALKLIEAVEEAPVILTQPESVVADLGDTVSFIVGASGFPLDFQWFRDGLAIPGATSARYTFTVTQADVDAMFTVRVSNDLGTDNSQAATVVLIVSPVQLVPWNQTWRYDRSASNLGTSWREIAFGDAAWPAGPGPLGFPANEATPVPVATSFATHNNITYYFRTMFVFDGEPTDYELVFSNFIDDGAVFYLNEVEVLRVEMPPAPAVIDFVTSAAAGGEWAAREDIVPSTFLVPGTNYLAVEVHQINTTSSDAILGLNLWGRPLPPGPLSITQDPQDATVEELKEAVFTVDVAGNGARFQWLKNGADIPGATRPTYTIEETVTADAGAYSVRVSNAFSTLTSQVAILTVFPDHTSPILLEADGSLNRTNILVTFSEKITESLATNASNYQLTSSDMATQLTINSLIYTNNGTAVLLITQARSTTVNYLLIVNNLTDVSPQNNLIASNSTAAVITEIELVGWYSTYKVYDPFPGFDPLDPGPGWQTPGFVPNASWAEGTGPFVYNAPNNELPIAPAPAYFSLSQGSTTKFFRNTFNYTASLLGATFKMQHMVDDGIVAYLNGQEFHRYNLPEGAVTPTTPGNPTVGAATLVDVNDIPGGNLVQGNNLLAVELHGTSSSDLDWVFGMSFKIRVKSLATGPVIILKQPADVTVVAGQPATFSFDGVGPNSYQWRINGTNVPNSNLPTFTIDPTTLAMDGLTVAVVALNGIGSATSSNAVLHILQDTFAPELVSGYASETRDSITISYNERIDPVSGADTSNYLVTDGNGGSFNVSSAMVVNDTNVVLQTATYNPLSQVKVTVNGVMDIASIPNTILPDSAVIIGFESVLITRTNTWEYNDQGGNLFSEGQWTSLGYDTEGWSSGVGTFVARNANPEAEPLPAGWPFTTAMTYGTQGGADYRTNFYFRTVVNIPGPLMGTVIASNLVDDGAVFYVNTVEVGRHRVTGAPTATTFAALRGDVGSGADAWDVFEFDASAFVTGDNLVAVTVHQTNNTSSDSVYNTEFFLRADPILIPGIPNTCEDPTITYDPDTDRVVITWPGSCKLVASDTADGIYTEVVGATSPYSVVPTGTKFYQTRNP